MQEAMVVQTGLKHERRLCHHLNDRFRQQPNHLVLEVSVFYRPSHLQV